MNKFDYLIIGSGLAGAVIAYRLNKAGKRCLVIDKRKHTGGNIHCEKINGITVHSYGPHIFHTSNEKVWKFINKFVHFNNYIHTPLACNDGKLYNLPFNMNTFAEVWGFYKPWQVKLAIENEIECANIGIPLNLEQQAIKNVGTTIYEMFIKGYTEKQWGRECIELPPEIINRIPVRLTYNNNYFNDKYQGIPIEGYNFLIDKLLEGVTVKLGCDYFEHREYYDSIADKKVYTGMIDEYFNYCCGELEYLSLKFLHKHLDEYNYQGTSIINHTTHDVDYTRVIEHKHFECLTEEELNKNKHTILTYEYPQTYRKGVDAFYPINSSRNNAILRLYKELIQKETGTIFVGRLAEYKYYDMDDVIERALTIKLD